MVTIVLEDGEARILVAVLADAEGRIREEYDKRYDTKIDKRLAQLSIDGTERIRRTIEAELPGGKATLEKA